VFYDNSAECYHCATVHPEFTKDWGVGPTDYLLESHPEFVYHCSPVKERSADTSLEDWEMYAVWPNWSIATGSSTGVAFVYNFTPAGPKRVRIVTHVMAAPSVSDREAKEEMDWWRHIVTDQDRPVCEAVQMGLNSEQVRDGPLLLDSEHIIQRFQTKLRAAFEGRAPSYVS
jgi:phenylpropionate dioxygenase-like ring-hydroxylating dioxygenase large terminal subunit